ncbi:hypothetical protein P691DRAFT_822337 [Macrolepiota fuliginosa MF-IS2]|uniref:NACHT domain-containing protein n=1 Tax=Macrolepiota fuliginosa MF-IS2 TaxID=1400762 RepID=A0A9P5WWJ4_9AGAR|nr:hypothetical protein P691DRAFT_822337 [Macrolepiota fuliginosa MF-IS2]
MSNTGILQGAHGFILNNPHLGNNYTHLNQNIHNTIVECKHPGLKILLEASMPDAFHDSSAQDPPPSCHPGTCYTFIDGITSWGLGTSRCTKSMLWMYGPAGIGKSAIAQTCLECLAERNKLGATLFSLVLLAPISEMIHIKNPTLVAKSTREQFQELLVKPLSQLGADATGIVEGLVIIIDGLDECGKGPGMHCDIIEVIMASTRNRNMPFHWVLLSRPETHIVGSFAMNGMHSLMY